MREKVDMVERRLQGDAMIARVYWEKESHAILAQVPCHLMPWSL